MAYDDEGDGNVRVRAGREEEFKSNSDTPRLAMVHDELDAGLAYLADRLDRAESALDGILRPLREKMDSDSPGRVADDGDFSPAVRTAAAQARKAHALGRRLDALIDRVQL